MRLYTALAEHGELAGVVAQRIAFAEAAAMGETVPTMCARGSRRRGGRQAQRGHSAARDGHACRAAPPGEDPGDRARADRARLRGRHQVGRTAHPCTWTSDLPGVAMDAKYGNHARLQVTVKRENDCERGRWLRLTVGIFGGRPTPHPSLLPLTPRGLERYEGARLGEG